MARIARPEAACCWARRAEGESAVEATTAPAVLIKSRRIILCLRCPSSASASGEVRMFVLSYPCDSTKPRGWGTASLFPLRSSHPSDQCGTELVQRNRLSIPHKNKLRGRDEVRFRKAFRDTDAHGLAAVLLEAGCGQPD